MSDTTATTFTRGHALLIGVGDYHDQRWRAPITAVDAQGVANALTDPTVAGYPPGQVTLLTNADATRAGVVRALEQFAARVTPEDTALIFFCGHGANGDDGAYHFAVQDTAFQGQGVRAGTGLSQSDMQSLLRPIRTRKLLVIINACFSGSVGATLGPDDTLGAPPPAQTSDLLLASGEGRVILTASRESQYSYFLRAQPHTFFGSALIEGLRSAPVGPGGAVGLYELYGYLYERVCAAAAGIGKQQEPVLNVVKGVGPFPVALRPGGEVSVPTLSAQPPVDTAVREVERQVLQALGTGSIAAGGNVSVDQRGSTSVSVSADAREGSSASVGDTAGGSIIKGEGAGGAATSPPRPVDLPTPDPRQPPTDPELQRIIERIAAIRDDIGWIEGLSAADREELEVDLERARLLASRGDRARMARRLGLVRDLLLSLAGQVPEAPGVAEALARLIRRVG